ncbi:hypothetical protein ACIGW4_07020 [Streptomyces sp. NPDC053513]|nr:hypothetical protein [Streptomyces sp. PanSC19]
MGVAVAYGPEPVARRAGTVPVPGTRATLLVPVLLAAGARRGAEEAAP